MRFDAWLDDRTGRLRTAGIDSARLDCLILAEDTIAQDRSWLLAHPEYDISDRLISLLDKKIAQRERAVPLAYIRGRSEFYGRMFTIREHVLVPRPESEDIIGLLKDITSDLPERPIIIDVGTGCGSLAISASLELPGSHVWATDIDDRCLTVARANADRLRADVRFAAADLLAPMDGNARDGADVSLPDTGLPAADVILANLPYVPDSHHINADARHEPWLAIFGGDDGMDLYRRMFAQLSDWQRRPSYIITEALAANHDQVCAIARHAGYTIAQTAGLVQSFRLTA